MRVSYQWLLELTGLDWPVETVAERLTLCGTACEHVEPTDQYFGHVVVAEVLDVAPIQGADKIRLATVTDGRTQTQVVCGAPNVAAGQKVALALPGAGLAGGLQVKETRIRGVQSGGMICSERGLGISDDHSGILVLGHEAEPGIPLTEFLDYHDYSLTFELTPNRPDSMCAFGLARDLAALALARLIKPSYELIEVGPPASEYVSVRIEDSDACPRYAARVVRNLKIGPSPWWLRKRLLASGLRPISNVVDITNLVMLECGHPLHAFDLDRFGSNEVVVRRGRDNERFTTLDGKEHTLTRDVLMITNGIIAVAAAGVMGGLHSEVTGETANVLLEAAYFDPSTIRKGRKQLGFVTESSSRFEKGADPNGIDYALHRAAFLLQSICGGEVCQGVVDVYAKRIQPCIINFRPERCNRVLGTAIVAPRMRQILTGLEFKVEGDDPLRVTVPTFRPDIEREIDLIEEIVRIEGFESVPNAVTNIGPLFTRILPEDRFRRELRQILTAGGFDEILTHGLVDSRLAANVHPDIPMVRISNPVSEDINVMRNSMVPSALEVIRQNLAHRNVDLRLFEVGKVYLPGSAPKDEVEERERLILMLTGSTEHTWRDRPRPFDFYDLAGILQTLTIHFGWSSVHYESANQAWLDETCRFQVIIHDHPVGWIGQLSPTVLRASDIKQAVVMAELQLEPLVESRKELTEYRPLPVFPAAPRDLALVVSSTVKAGDLVAAVYAAAGNLAETVEIFDLYEGEQIGKDRKSIAMSICYRSAVGSLSSDEVNTTQAIVVERLKRDFNAEVRDK